MRGALKIAEVIAERACGSPWSACPKTIDNDIPFIDQSFGFQTAFAEATRVDPGRARGGQSAPERRRPGAS